MASCSGAKDDCTSTLNVISALIDFESINVNNEFDQQKLVEICETKYQHLLNDYIHVVTKHKDELEDIFELITINHLNKMTHCSVEHCVLSQRHNTQKSKDDTTNTNNLNFIFYRELFDSIHCYLYHSWDYGFRANINIPSDKLPVFERIKNNNKYNINDKYVESDTTFMDAFNDKIICNDMKNVLESLKDDEYDTDAVIMDIDEANQKHNDQNSNIKKMLENIQHYVILKDFIFHCELMQHCFSIGYTFYYWDYYKAVKDENNTYYANKNAHLGYQPHELHIKQKYSSLKEEILNNTIFTLNQHSFTTCVRKAGKYLHSETAKEMKSVKFAEKRLHFGIQTNTPVSKEHLLAIILRCDEGDLCTAFCATFRKKQPFEPLSSIKNRNREYAIWSRLIRETVEYYGQCGRGDDVDGEDEFVNKTCGPFYCGMSIIMTFPEFNIRICSPTSTSIHKEVASRFADEGGMVIKLNNTGHCNACNLRCFSCGWISRYTEEFEYLFSGGRYQLRVQNVIHKTTMNNYKEFCNAFFYFDCMIKGTTLDEDDVSLNAKDHLALDVLIKRKLDTSLDENTNINIDEYVSETFDTILAHHTQIVINLYEINTHLNDIKDLLIYTESNETPKEKINLIKERTFRLFTNIKTLYVYSTNDDGWEVYEFNLLEFLSSIYFVIPLNFKIIIKATRQDEDTSWLYDEYHDIESKINYEHYSVSLSLTNDNQDANSCFEDCLVIEKISSSLL